MKLLSAHATLLQQTTDGRKDDGARDVPVDVGSLPLPRRRAPRPSACCRSGQVQGFVSEFTRSAARQGPASPLISLQTLTLSGRGGWGEWERSAGG